MADFFFVPHRPTERRSIMDNAIKEGSVYKVMSIREKTFELRYGYYDERDRSGKYNEPIPIYPDFTKYPEYTSDGLPIVTAMQDACEYYEGRIDTDSCGACAYFRKEEELFGICECEKRRQLFQG